MRKLYSLLFLFQFFFFYRASGQVVSFSFAGSDGDETSWSSSSTATGIQSCAITRGPGVTAIANADRFNSKGWTTGSSPDLNDYIQFTIMPMPGYSVTLSTLVLQHQRSVSGPKSFVVRTSLNDFSTDATEAVTITGANTNQVSNFGFPSPITTTAPLIIRIYAFNADTENGTWGPGESYDGNDLVVFGSFLNLPVRFMNVKAAWKEKQVDVSWTNATESDVLYYIVERSANGQDFAELERIHPKMNNGGMVDYRSADRTLLSQAAYYRIKAVETTGHVIFSQVVKVEKQATGTALSLYPNPVQQGSQLTLQMNGLKEGSYTITVVNAIAQVVHQQTVTVNNGTVTQGISLQNWQKGIYVLKINGATTLQQRFIIQ